MLTSWIQWVVCLLRFNYFPSGSPGYKQLKASTAPIVISHDTLVRSCKMVEGYFCPSFHGDYCVLDESGTLKAPLNEYLSSLALIERLTAVFDVYKRAGSCLFSNNTGLIEEMSSDLDFVGVLSFVIEKWLYNECELLGPSKPTNCQHYWLDSSHSCLPFLPRSCNIYRQTQVAVQYVSLSIEIIF